MLMYMTIEAGSQSLGVLIVGFGLCAVRGKIPGSCPKKVCCGIPSDAKTGWPFSKRVSPMIDEKGEAVIKTSPA